MVFVPWNLPNMATTDVIPKKMHHVMFCAVPMSMKYNIYTEVLYTIGQDFLNREKLQRNGSWHKIQVLYFQLQG